MIRNGGAARVRTPDLKFHSIRGSSIKLETSGRRATKLLENSSGGYMVFSDRPIEIDERVHIRLIGIPDSGCLLWFGLTHICPDSQTAENMVDSWELEGYWMKQLDDEFSPGTRNDLQLFISYEGDLYYSINGVNKGIACSGVDTTFPLWIVADTLGSMNSIEFVSDGNAERARPPFFRSYSSISNFREIEVNERLIIRLNAIDRTRAVKFVFTVTSLSRCDWFYSRYSKRLTVANRYSIRTMLVVRVLSVVSTSQWWSRSSKIFRRYLRLISIRLLHLRLILLRNKQILETIRNEKSSSSLGNCKICMDKEVNAVIARCGHTHFCYDCAIKCKNNAGGKCPNCRQHISMVVKIIKN